MLPKQTFKLNGYEVVNSLGVQVKSFGYFGMSTETAEKAYADAVEYARGDGMLMFGEVEVREIMVVTTRKYRPRYKAPAKDTGFDIPPIPTLEHRAQLA